MRLCGRGPASTGIEGPDHGKQRTGGGAHEYRPVYALGLVNHPGEEVVIAAEVRPERTPAGRHHGEVEVGVRGEGRRLGQCGAREREPQGNHE